MLWLVYLANYKTWRITNFQCKVTCRKHFSKYCGSMDTRGVKFVTIENSKRKSKIEAAGCDLGTFGPLVHHATNLANPVRDSVSICNVYLLSYLLS